MNYGLFAVASSRSKRAPFHLNNPRLPAVTRQSRSKAPTTLEVACLSAKALHAFSSKNFIVNFRICKSRNLQNQSYFSSSNKEEKYSPILTPSFFISFSLSLTSVSCQRSGGSANITLSRLKFLTSSRQPSQR